MSISFELANEFLQDQGLPLTLADMRYGFERGWIHPETFVRWAAGDVRRGRDYELTHKIASLSRPDYPDILEILSSKPTTDERSSDSDSKRKWLYLQLAAAFARRADLPDPLGVVEQIYADFDYPPAIRGLVRYMPAEKGDALGETAIIQRWRDYLKAERRALGAEG